MPDPVRASQSGAAGAVVVAEDEAVYGRAVGASEREVFAPALDVGVFYVEDVIL